jgi:hypothetical protein
LKIFIVFFFSFFLYIWMNVSILIEIDLPIAVEITLYHALVKICDICRRFAWMDFFKNKFKLHSLYGRLVQGDVYPICLFTYLFTIFTFQSVVLLLPNFLSGPSNHPHLVSYRLSFLICTDVTQHSNYYRKRYEIILFFCCRFFGVSAVNFPNQLIWLLCIALLFIHFSYLGMIGVVRRVAIIVLYTKTAILLLLKARR